MKEDEAKKLLTEHVKALTLILGETPSKLDSSEATEALEAAREGQKALKKTLLDRVKDLPVITQVQQLGTAGTVAISAAAVTQADLAKDATEVFVAEIANDIVMEVIQPPFFLDTFIDFHELNDWGQIVMAEKVSEAKAFVAEVSEPQPISQPTDPSPDPKPESSVSSNNSSSEKSSQNGQPEQTDKSSESEKTEQESNKENSSNEKQEDKDQKESKESKSLNNNNQVEKSENVNKPSNFPIVETPIDSFSDDIKPHSTIRQVSPTN